MAGTSIDCACSATGTRTSWGPCVKWIAPNTQSPIGALVRVKVMSNVWYWFSLTVKFAGSVTLQPASPSTEALQVLEPDTSLRTMRVTVSLPIRLETPIEARLRSLGSNENPRPAREAQV